MTSTPTPESALASTFRQHAPRGANARLESEAKLEAILQEHLSKAQAAWPELRLEPAEFIAHLAERAGPWCDEASLAAAHGSDLYLALGCGRRMPKAVAEMVRLLEPAALARQLREPPEVLEEISQILAKSVIVGDVSKKPEILDYSGRGSLQSWLRVLALNAARKLCRGNAPQALDDVLGLLEEVADSQDPEVALIKARYRDEFSAAFRDAVRRLPSRELAVLRLHLGGMDIGQIGTCYGVHRATVARWIAGARDRLLEGTRAALRLHLKAREEEANSLIRLLQSGLEVSLARALSE